MLHRNQRHFNSLWNIASEGIIEPDQNMATETPSSDPNLQITTEVPSTDARYTGSGRISVPSSQLVEDQNWQ